MTQQLLVADGCGQRITAQPVAHVQMLCNGCEGGMAGLPLLLERRTARLGTAPTLRTHRAQQRTSYMDRVDEWTEVDLKSRRAIMP
jgi:hypothetical protein